MSLYVVLGLEEGASPSDIKRAYRRLARRYHPDINPGDPAAELAFRQIVQAYEILSDPDRRRRYDLGLEVVEEEASAPAFQGFDFSVAASGEVSTFGDLFADVLRAGGQAAAAEPAASGADLHVSLALSFEQAMRGGQARVTVTRLDRCGECQGSGRIQTPVTRCQQCRGAGTLRLVRGHMVFTKVCGACAGAGQMVSRACPICRGEGVSPRSEAVAVPLPPGVADGSRLRISGKGHAGPRGGRAGDLSVTVQVQPHPFFRRVGDDLHVTVPLAIHEAALGTRVEIPTLDGPATLRIPPGTQSGQRFRMSGRGVPIGRDGARGDLLVEVRLVLPRMLGERSKELLREFGRLHPEDVRRDAWGREQSDAT